MYMHIMSCYRFMPVYVELLIGEIITVSSVVLDYVILTNQQFFNLIKHQSEAAQ